MAYRRHTKKMKLKKSGVECGGISGNYYRKSDEMVNGNDSSTSSTPSLDRHGFVKSHVMHNQVSSEHMRPLDRREKIIRRESKWLEMINNWNEALKNPEQIKKRCQKGIPQSVRSPAWTRLTAADKLREQNLDLYEDLVKQSENSDWEYVIRKDIPRTFRHHSMFYDNNSRGQEDLYNVLIAYSTYDKETGYNQALAPIAAVLLMHMPPEETFWVLVSICKYYLPGYYGKEMEAVKLDALMFSQILESQCPHVSTHMTANDVEPMLYLVEWLVCILSRSLPFDTVLRIWDMFFCQGYKILFKVAIAIMKVVFPTAKELEGKDDYETSQILSTLPKQCVEEDILIPEILNTHLTYKDLKKVHKQILKDHPELTVTRFTGGLHSL